MPDGHPVNAYIGVMKMKNIFKILGLVVLVSSSLTCFFLKLDLAALALGHFSGFIIGILIALSAFEEWFDVNLK